MNTPELSKSLQPRVAILGVTGMIGSAVYGVLKDSCRLVITYRSEDKLQLLYRRYGQGSGVEAIKTDFSDWYAGYQEGFAGQALSPAVRNFSDRLAGCDWVINAMGITKAIADRDPLMTLFINGAVPHILAALFGKRLIHITTDCVFDGTAGAPYHEDSLKRPVDLYGLSKSIGEPTTALVLRTSTVGPELGTTYGLLDWLRSQSGLVPGFTNYLWNGITTHELGRICQRLVSGQIPHPGVGTYHIFSEDITKQKLLELFCDLTGRPIEIVPTLAPVAIDRRLSSRHQLNTQLCLPALGQMIADLAQKISVGPTS
jgi:dTDP-4-dehydrorhamnose reductase